MTTRALGRALRPLLLTALLGPTAAAGQSVSPQDMAAMMQGMATMMRLWDAYSTYGDAGAGGRSPLDSLFPSDPWSSSGSVTPATPPWTMPGAGAGWSQRPLPGGMPPGPWSAPGQGGGGSSPWHRPSPPAVTTLEGTWQGSNGEILRFRGERFQIVAPGRGEVSGTFMVAGDRLVAYVPAADTAVRYRFELRGRLLAVADEQDQVLLFRRVR